MLHPGFNPLPAPPFLCKKGSFIHMKEPFAAILPAEYTQGCFDHPCRVRCCIYYIYVINAATYLA